MIIILDIISFQMSREFSHSKTLYIGEKEIEKQNEMAI